MQIIKTLRCLANIGIGKYRLPNILNWLAMRLFYLSHIFSIRLISWAHFLNSENQYFKKNLISLECIEKQTPNVKQKKKSFNYLSITEGCKLLSNKINFLHTNQNILLSLPKVINKNIPIPKEYACSASLPDAYFAELDNVVVFGGTDLIITSNGLCLYDEVNKNEVGRYGNKSPIIKAISSKEITVEFGKIGGAIDSGIHFTKDHSVNYFHWLIECLPRFSLIGPSLDKNIPLLIDNNIPSQSLEALNLINSDNRPLIKLDFQKPYTVKKLFYPSRLSAVYDNYSSPPLYNKDAVYSPLALNFIRNSVLQKLNITHQRNFRKIYVSRKDSTIRKLLNNDQIEEILITKGFEIIFPEKLSFAAQVAIFSQAKTIVGQSGAGMTNFIFAPNDCKILMLVSDNEQTNLHLFGAIAQLLNIPFEILVGKSNYQNAKSFHADFSIDVGLLLNYLDDAL